MSRRPDWSEVRAAIESRLESARLEIERLSDHDQTQFCRGRIAALRDLLTLDSERPTVVHHCPPESTLDS